VCTHLLVHREVPNWIRAWPIDRSVFIHISQLVKKEISELPGPDSWLVDPY